MEDTSKSTLLFDSLYPKIEKSLSSSSNLVKLREFYGEVIGRNNEALSDSIPCKAIYVDRRIEDKYYNAIGLDPKEIMALVKASGHIGDNWHTVQNPMYISLILLVIYFNNKGKRDMVDQTMLICSIYMYRNIRSKYFSKVSENTINCMKFTMGRLSYKNDLKKYGSIIKTIGKKSGSYLNNWLIDHKKEITGRVTDKTICDMVNRNHRDYAKMMNNFYAEFRKDLEAENYLNVDQDINTDDQYIESDNVSFMVEKATQKVMSKFNLSVGPDTKIMQQVVAREPGCSINNLRNMLHFIYNGHDATFNRIVGIIIHVYLFEYKRKVEDIKTMDFEVEMRKYYKGQKIDDKNLNEMKMHIDKVMEGSGLNKKITRDATKNDCKRAFFLYVVIYIRYCMLG